MKENLNPEAKKFFDMLAATQAPLWKGCHNHLELLISLATLSLKSDYNMSKRSVQNFLCHPSNGEAWKHFDRLHLEFFSQDPRNFRLGLYADDFNRFGQYGKSYSCWPIILTPYNLPPRIPSNPKHKIDVYLQPLEDELLNLWNDGILTYDMSLRQNFMMKVVLMWTINDFPTYEILSGWITIGRLGCPIYMERTKTFTLKHYHKGSYFDFQQASYQDDDFVGLQVVLHIDQMSLTILLLIFMVMEKKYLLGNSYIKMVDRGTSDGRRPFNRGKSRGVLRRDQPTINFPTSTIHISTLQSTIPILQWGTLPTIQEEPQPTFVGYRDSTTAKCLGGGGENKKIKVWRMGQ
ncbi:hypothetical protein CR513_55132, partial [Mucuna pruriens]